MSFQIFALPLEPFTRLFSLDDDVLVKIGAKRYIADRRPGFPCRVSLEDAAPGERVILAPYTHQDADSPYRASGPVFVRERARPASLRPGEVPALLRSRLLSLRAYDAAGLMVEADVVDGRALEALIARMLTSLRVAYLHVHYAKPGCFACRIDRA